MEIRRSIGAFTDKLKPPTPPKEWEDLFGQVIDESAQNIQAFGRGIDAHLDYYGRVRGIEKGRIIVPLGELEASYHVSRIPGETIFTVVREGIFPNSD